ncbi:hypothetical protein F5J09_15100 (plasmid) [Lacticaseibacillus paracasei]|nr:hypothetical protein F5J09_15100 [Lacticaseibacillus paracasei]
MALRSLSPISLSVREMIFRKIRKSFLFFVNANGIEISFCVLKSQNVVSGLKSIFETDFKRHSEPRLPSTAQINH